MFEEIKIYEHGLEKYSRKTIIRSNFLMVAWVALGTLACWFFKPFIAWSYLGFFIVMVGIVLRGLLCPNCYYHNKWCCLGWGKLSALFFKKRGIENFSFGLGQSLAPTVYGFLAVIPLIFITVSLVQEFTLFKIIVAVLFLLFSFYSSVINRKKDCAQCKMKLICKGNVCNC